jgi:hypothetical protein
MAKVTPYSKGLDWDSDLAIPKAMETAAQSPFA